MKLTGRTPVKVVLWGAPFKDLMKMKILWRDFKQHSVSLQPEIPLKFRTGSYRVSLVVDSESVEDLGTSEGQPLAVS